MQITTLGKLDIAINGQTVDWLTSQRLRTSFFIFVAVERDVSRERLQGIFWPEADPERARRSLNQLIYTLRRSLSDEVIVTDGERVRLASDTVVDAVQFARAAEAGQHDEALSCYRGRFLNDAALVASAEFEQWIDAKRATFERLHRRVRRETLDELAADGDLHTALSVAREWIDVEPQDDEAHHRYLALLVQLGHRAEAIAHFDRYRMHLRATGLEPLEETTALIEAIRARPRAAGVHRSSAQLPMPDTASAGEQPTVLSAISSLIGELRRRRVIGVMTVYAIMTWGTIEISSTVFPLLNLPSWTATLVVVLALLAAPFVFFFAWVYDITPQGVRRTPSRETSGPLAAVPRLLPRRAAILIAVPVLLYAGWMAYDNLHVRKTPGAVAVFPFCVTGEGLENTADDIAVLLARGIDAVPELTTADPNIVLPAAAAAHVDCRDVKSAAGVADRIGATRFMLGSVVRADQQIRATATLYKADGAVDWSVTTTATAQQWLLVVDSLIRAAVEKQGGTSGNRLLSVAAVTTRSNDALLAYLEGERFMRKLEWSRASDAYRRAVALDSTFALAWLRLATALHGWAAPAHEYKTALATARTFAVRLPEREQRLLHALDPFMRGAAADAIDRLKQYLGTYPDDAFAWEMLGSTELHYGQLLGRDLIEARRAYQNAVDHGSQGAALFLAWTYFLRGEFDQGDSVAQQVLKHSPHGDWVLGLEAVPAFVSRDQARVEAMLQKISAQRDELAFGAIVWAHAARNFDAMEAILERIGNPRSESARDLIALTHSDLMHTRGRPRQAQQDLDRVASSSPAVALYYRVIYALDPAAPAAPEELRALRSALLSVDTTRSSPPPEGLDRYALFHGMHMLVRLFLLGRISAALAEYDVAENYARELEEVTPMADAPSAHRNFATSIRAYSAWQRGNAADVLAWLDRIVIEVVFPLNEYLLFAHNNERLLRADALASLGRNADAVRWYQTVLPNYYGTPYETHALRRFAELYERVGRRADALAVYRRLEDLLSNCEPAFAPVRTYARQRIAALKAERLPLASPFSSST